MLLTNKVIFYTSVCIHNFLHIWFIIACPACVCMCAMCFYCFVYFAFKLVYFTVGVLLFWSKLNIKRYPPLRLEKMRKQLRNVGLKSGGGNSEGDEAPLGPGARGGENGEEVSLLIWLWGLGECHELSQRGSGWNPAWKRFNLISADRLR